MGSPGGCKIEERSKLLTEFLFLVRAFEINRRSCSIYKYVARQERPSMSALIIILRVDKAKEIRLGLYASVAPSHRETNK